MKDVFYYSREIHVGIAEDNEIVLSEDAGCESTSVSIPYDQAEGIIKAMVKAKAAIDATAAVGCTEPMRG